MNGSATILPTYEARVLEVMSGDDLILMVDLNVDDLFKRVRARLHGVDTPDAYRSNGSSEAGTVRDEVKTLVRGKSCRIQVHSQQRGGWIVTLHVLDERSPFCLNTVLIERGFVYRQQKQEDAQ